MRFNSPIMEFMNTTAQFVALNLIFVICCLPIVTIGPALAALYQVILREVRGEHGYLIRKFFQHFKEMFVQSFLSFAILSGIILVLLYNIAFWNGLGSAFAHVILILICIMFLIVVSAFIYIFPLMARFKNSFKLTMKNAFLIALSNPKKTLLLLLIQVIAVGINFIFPPAKVFMIFIGFVFIAYCNSYILNKVFYQYETNECNDITYQPQNGGFYE